MYDPMMETELMKARQSMPRFWWNIYQGGIDAGFSQEQAMALLQTWILSTNAAGIRPPSSFGPGSDKPGE